MLITRKLVVLALAVCSFTAVNATAASALSIVSEATGVTCTNVTETNAGTPEFTGGCAVRAESIGHFELGGLGGLVMINCSIILEGFLGGNAEFKGNYSIGVCEPPTTGFVPCATMAEKHVGMEVTGAPVGGVYPVEASFCFDPTSVPVAETECHVAGTFRELAHNNQRYVFAHTNQCEAPNGGFSIQGTILVTPDGTHPQGEFRE